MTVQSTRLGRLCSLGLLWAVGILAIAMALRLGLWRSGSPGPGLFPFLAALAIVVLATIGMMAAALRRWPAAPAETIHARGRWRIALYVVALIAYALLLEPLGFHAATTLALLVISRAAERLRWRTVVPLIAGTLFFTHLVFARWLGVYFPAGTLWGDLLG
ncbi:MAG: tripartite tricarboxylate transporter TctB family protein [candidate division NC10 bacterium]|nr:tripartite tricarboxylate transporter TctB family protein [candidate division NC10 bacterium]